MDLRTPLAGRLIGLTVDDLPDILQARIAATGHRVVERMRRQGRALPGAPDIDLELPPLLVEMLAAVLAHARQVPGTLATHAETLARTWTEDMPALLVDSLVSNETTCAAIFHTPLEPARLPRLMGAIARLHDLVDRVPGTLDTVPGTLAEHYPRTHFGRCMPMLYTFPHDRAAMAAELAAGRQLHAVIDARLAAPLIHELSHLHRARRPLWPPYLEECVAGWVGACALPSLVWPDPGTDIALFGAHWFAQVGQALEHAVGRDAMLNAHSGAVPWPRAMPQGYVDTAERLGWQQQLRLQTVHLLGENTRPMPWVHLGFLAATDQLTAMEPSGGWTLDALEAVDPVALGEACPERPPEQHTEVVRCALRTMFNFGEQHPDTGAWRVRLETPTDPIVVDWRRGLARGPRRGRALAEPTWWLPPALCHGWHRRGVHRHVVRFEPTATRDPACHDLARRLAVPGDGGDRRGAGWSLEAVRGPAAAAR